MTDLAATLALAAGAGLAAFFSPCAYALLPGYVGYYVAATEGARPPVGGAAVRGLAAAGGVAVAFGLLAAVAAVAGAALEPVFPVLEALVGVALVGLGGFVLVGGDLHLTVSLPHRRTTVLGFGLFGALYAVAAAGCVAPLFLAVVVQSLTLSPAGTVAAFAAFAGTVGALLVATTVLTALGREVSAAVASRYVSSATRIAGIVLVAAGVGQLAVALR